MSQAQGWGMNTAMLELWASPGPSELTADLEAALADGLTERQGCLVLASQSSPAQPADFDDATGYEAFINHLHIDTDDGSAVSKAIHAAARVAEMVQSRMLQSRGDERPVRLIVSAEHRDAATVRFHRLRAGEEWLADDLESYPEAVCVRDVALPTGFDEIAARLRTSPEDWHREAALAALTEAISEASPDDEVFASRLAATRESNDQSAQREARVFANRLDEEYLAVDGRFTEDASSVDPAIHARLFSRARLAMAIAYFAEGNFKEAIYEAFHGADESPRVLEAARSVLQ